MKRVILLHGRGGTAHDMCEFAQEHLPEAEYIALEAHDHRWYPLSFMVERERNEPYLSESLKEIENELVDSPHAYLLGFSQGACLALEYAARNPKKYAGIIAFSGGLIGDTILPPQGSLQGTPIIISCSQNDPHIPISRVIETAEAFKQAGASVTLHTYPGNSHTITQEELDLARSLLEEA